MGARERLRLHRSKRADFATRERRRVGPHFFYVLDPRPPFLIFLILYCIVRGVMSLKTPILAWPLLCLSIFTFASEPDDISSRAEVLKHPDASAYINAIVNQQISGAINEFNRGVDRWSDFSCAEKHDFFIHVLRIRLISTADVPNQMVQPFSYVEHYLASTQSESAKMFRPSLGNHPWRRDLEDEPILADFPRYGFTQKFEDSIFSAMTDATTDPENGSVSFFAMKLFKNNFLAGSMNFGGNVVGIDKIGHLFWEGWIYWNTVNADEKKLIEPALAWGEDVEDSIFGRGRGLSEKTTWGVYSYADLAANISGLLFWDRLFNGANPHVKCDGRKVTAGVAFDIMDYASAYWDQGINCSAYRPKVEAQINLRVNALGLSCPVEPARCVDLPVHPLAKRFTHPDCLKKQAAKENRKGNLPITLEDLRAVGVPGQTAKK